MLRYFFFTILILGLFGQSLKSQVQLEEAFDFTVKTLDSEIIELFPILDEGKIVVINFFSTSCGPCQTYAHDFQEAYENFGENQGNVYFHGINYNGNNYQVAQFADIYQLFLPLTSGLEGGGNAAFELYETVSYPTVFIITPDRQIVNNYVWEPSVENITDAVVAAGGILVGSPELASMNTSMDVYPNPATDYINIVFDVDQSEHLLLKLLNNK
jgi:thiol-disulfide isomerase/thioredoxin